MLESLFNKVAGCEYYEILKNTYFEEQLPAADSADALATSFQGTVITYR